MDKAVAVVSANVLAAKDMAVTVIVGEVVADVEVDDAVDMVLLQLCHQSSS